ncbi:MAG TPA: rRNA maturation RNase YbeY [Thermoanaerobaculia bacterium]|nr:rRNA maturation RNase YbeY [Thermoanaerobaculia bacterium]
MRGSGNGAGAVGAVAGGGGGGGAGGGIEIAWLNPNRYGEAAARLLRPWLAALLAALSELAVQPPGGGRRRLCSCGVRFAGDRAMRRLNREFRGIDRTTDVLSFPGDAGGWDAGGWDAGGPGAGQPDAGGHLGDIVISVPAARRQAAAAGHGPERELRVLLLHGVLHCLGHDHEVDGGEMERLERRLRRRWLGPARRGPGAG